MATQASRFPITVFQGRWLKYLGSLLKLIFFVMLAAWIFRSVAFAPYYVLSSSMMPSLRQGDFFIASRWDYGISPRSFAIWAPDFPRIGARLPKRGDIVVFHSPAEPGANFVKRVVGLPGDTVTIARGIISINGVPAHHRPIEDFIAPQRGDVECVVVRDVVDQRRVLPSGESGCLFSRSIETLPGGAEFPTLDIAPAGSDTVPPTVIPAGHLYLVGDNRDASLDSRFPVSVGGLGFVPIENVLGKLRWVVGKDADGVRFIGHRAFASD